MNSADIAFVRAPRALDRARTRARAARGDARAFARGRARMRARDARRCVVSSSAGGRGVAGGTHARVSRDRAPVRRVLDARDAGTRADDAHATRRRERERARVDEDDG
jgi:hypothetical protein